MKNHLNYLRRLSCLFLLLHVGLLLKAANYYFSSTLGNDSRTNIQAQSPATPWKSLTKLNAIFGSLHPGDSVLFKRGDVFEGAISITASGSATSPIVLSAYGEGAQPRVSGLTTLTNWTTVAQNSWETNVPTGGASMNVVLVDGRFQPVGRYPNSNTANGGYLPVEHFSGNTSITGSALSSTPNWTGGEVVIRKARWVLDRNPITAHNGNTISYVSESDYHATAGYGYFIQNHPRTLDQNGEWYYQNKKVGIFFAAGSPADHTVQGSIVSTLVSIAGQENIVFSGIAFTGANGNAFNLSNAKNLAVSHCTIQYSGINAINAENVNDLKIEGTSIDHTNNNALNLENCSGTIIRNNTITNTGLVAGMGKGNSGSYEAILHSGDNTLVEGNTIENTGYIGITFRGEAVTIKNNYINRFTLVKDDGSGIYTWNNISGAPLYTNRTVTGNIVLNGRSSGQGTDDNSKKFSHGIYLDDNATGVNVSGNTVANCEGFGLYIHNARNNSITRNTAYNNTVQITMVHDDIAPNHPIRNTAVTNNVFFSLLPEQLVAEYKSRADDLKEFGAFSQNSYCRPFDETAIIGVLKNVEGSYRYERLDLQGWQALYGEDVESKGSPITFKPYVISGFAGSNQYGNGQFGENIGGLYAYSSANNCQTSWHTGALDGGSLAVQFTSITNNSKGTVIIGVGALTAGKRYLLRYSLKGGDENKMIEVYLRKSQAPYNDVTERKLVKIDAVRREAELLFTAIESTSDGSIGIDVPEQRNPVYLDNIDLREATVTEVNPADSVKFIYNASNKTSVTNLGSSFIDVRETVYDGTVSTPPFSSVVLLASGGASGSTGGFCSATGSLLCERWTGIDGNDVAQVPQTSTPTEISQLPSFEVQADRADQYGTRLRGYLCVPQTGNYTFWIAGDDATELYLGDSDVPSTKVKIAYNLSWTGFREWNKFASQKSTPIFLEAGKRYFIEALHKEGAGGDHLSVAWQLPDGSTEAPIAGNRLAPYQEGVVLLNQTINFPVLQNTIYGAEPLHLNATSSSGLPVTYQVVSGPATVTDDVLHIHGAGSVTVEAAQPGNAVYEVAVPVRKSLLVAKAEQALSFSSVSSKTISDVPFPLEASATSGLPVSFRLVSGPATIRDGTITLNGLGTVVVEAFQEGNANFNLALPVIQSFSVNSATATKRSQTISFGTLPYKTYTSPSFLLSATASSGLPVEYRVVSGPVVVTNNQVTIAGVGEVTVEANQGGDAYYHSAAPVRRSFTVGKAAQIISFPTMPGRKLGDPPFVLPATTSSGLPVFYRLVNGPATVSGDLITLSGIGTVTVEASQAGNQFYNAAYVVTRSFTVAAADNNPTTTSVNAGEQSDKPKSEEVFLTKIAIQVFPTPVITLGVIRVTADRSFSGRLEVRNMNGKLVQSFGQKRFKEGERVDFSLPAASLPAGMYVVQLTMPKGIMTQTFQVLR